MAITSCCNNCPNKGCGAYHDRCEKYQAELMTHRIAVANDRQGRKISSALYEINKKGRQARIRKASV